MTLQQIGETLEQNHWEAEVHANTGLWFVGPVKNGILEVVAFGPDLDSALQSALMNRK